MNPIGQQVMPSKAPNVNTVHADQNKKTNLMKSPSLTSLKQVVGVLTKNQLEDVAVALSINPGEKSLAEEVAFKVEFDTLC